MRTPAFLPPLVALALVASCGGPDLSDDEVAEATDELGETGAYYTVRADTRKCGYPLCGGYYVRAPNKATIKCSDGTSQAECYLAALDFGKLALTPDAAVALRATIDGDDLADVVLRGKLGIRAVLNQGRWGYLAVTEAFTSDAPAAISGTLHRLSTLGQSCAYYPCETVKAAKLNSTSTRAVHEAALGGRTQAQRDAALLGAYSRDGVIVAGTLTTTGRGAAARTTFTATQRFIRWTPPASTARACGVDLDEALSVASEGLLFMSEGDYPFEHFEFAGAAQATLTNARFLRVAGLPAGTAVETRTASAFFGRLTNDPEIESSRDLATEARYRALRKVLDQHLTNLKVIRTGAIEIRVHVIGSTRCGDLAGLATTAIET